jgi:hypothetical protein
LDHEPLQPYTEIGWSNTGNKYHKTPFVLLTIPFIPFKNNGSTTGYSLRFLSFSVFPVPLCHSLDPADFDGDTMKRIKKTI